MLLSDPIPLRTSESLNAYREASALPLWFGDLRHSPQALVQISDTEFLAADHAMTITAVQIDGQDVQGYGWGTATDGEGVTYTVVTLTAPLPAGTQITACGLGELSPRTGALIENPADVLERIFQRSGYTITDAIYQGLYQLRSQCAAEGLVIAGRVPFAVTLREKINEIMRSIGGGWCSGNFWLYPTLDAVTAVPANTPERLPGALVSACVATADASYDTLHIKFDDQSYVANHRQAIKLRERPSLGEGRATVTLLAPWLRSMRAATLVAQRLLTRASGEAYVLTIDASPVDPPVIEGEVIAVQSPRLPQAGLWPVTVIVGERINAQRKLLAELIIALPSLVFEVVSRTIAGDITQLPAVEVAFANGIATFTIVDGNGKPITNARCTLDRVTPLRTDNQGVVRFPSTPGAHVLSVAASGYQPFSLPFVL